MGRVKTKPGFNSAALDQDMLKQVSDYYQELICSAGENINTEESAYKYVIQTAEAFHISPMKMRKLLITAGVYSTSTSRYIAGLYADGLTVKEIQDAVGFKRSSINGYLPYSKVIYNHSEKSVGADRIELYRKRQKLVKELIAQPSEATLWSCIIEFQGFLFHTALGLPFKYTVKVGRNGQYTKELVVDRRQESKTLSGSSIILAFKNALSYEGIVSKPKALGDTRGISYIYPMLYYFGLIQVPENLKERMDGRNPKKCRRKINLDINEKAQKKGKAEVHMCENNNQEDVFFDNLRIIKIVQNKSLVREASVQVDVFIKNLIESILRDKPVALRGKNICSIDELRNEIISINEDLGYDIHFDSILEDVMSYHHS